MHFRSRSITLPATIYSVARMSKLKSHRLSHAVFIVDFGAITLAKRKYDRKFFSEISDAIDLALLGLLFCLSGAQSNTIPEVVAGRGFTGWRQNTRATGGVVRQERGFLFFGLLRADPRNCSLRCS